jgi:glycosyltransferase involved in cell wall biosynthesis
VKVLHLSAYDLFGGAAKAAFRLHDTLRKSGVDSTMLVRRRDSNRPDVMPPAGAVMKLWSRVQRRCDRLPLVFMGAGAADFSPGWVPDGLARHVAALAPDVVHLHWVTDGFFQIETLQKLLAPVVWTMHDMWPFTGGCHYAGTCGRFAAACGCCPLLGSRRESDLSRKGLERRRAVIGRSSPAYVSPSRWLADQAHRSSLLRNAEIKIIAYGIDTACFRPRDRSAIRTGLSLPQDKMLILVGAAQLKTNLRKGFAHFRIALNMLQKMVPMGAIEIVLFGSGDWEGETLEGFRVHSLGVLEGDEALACAYASADVFVAPSLEDNLPNTVIEAMAAGIPVVAYNAGGIPEIIDDGQNGLLAPVGRPEALAQTLARMLNDHDFRSQCRQRSRQKILRSFDNKAAAEKYRELYGELSSHRA